MGKSKLKVSELFDGKPYDKSTKAAPVVSEATIQRILILMMMASFHAELLDMKGAFLHGNFAEGEQLY